MSGGLKTAQPVAVIVAVGDELLFGQTVNTNGAWLGRELSALGLHVLRQEVVSDGREAIQCAVGRALTRAEVVVVTGGLGPTPDDLTRSAVADLLGHALEEDPALVSSLRDRFRALGHEDLPSNNRRMALVPAGAEVMANPVGSAPGLVLRAAEEQAIVLLPGIPGEMRGIYRERVVPYLRRTFGHRLIPVHHRVIHTTGIPESLLAREMARLLPGGLAPVSLAFLPDKRGVRVRLTAQGIGEEEARDRFDAVEAPLEGLLRPYRYQAVSGDLAEALGNALAQGGWTVAVGESCTGGLIAKRITDRPGSSRYFLGGVVAYSNGVKIRQLGVDPGLLERDGAVSRSVAKALALGAAERFGASAGIGVTGVAGPDGGTEDKPVGTVCYAVVLDGRVALRKERFLGDREAVRERASQAAMALLLALVEGRAL